MPAPLERFVSAGRSPGMARRCFLRGLSLVGLGLGWGGASVMGRIVAPLRRCCVVGPFERALIYQKVFRESYAGIAELVDTIDLGRSALGSVEKRWAARQVDTVIVAAPWDVGPGFIVRAFRAGCDVLAETEGLAETDALVAVLEAWKSSGRAFQLLSPDRALPANARIKALVAGGQIGGLLSVDFNVWPGRLGKKNSDDARGFDRAPAYLLQHFDLLNGWIGATPVQLSPGAAWRSASANTVCVSYDNGVIASYSPHRSDDRPGPLYRVALNGTLGRIEHSVSIGAFDAAVRKGAKVCSDDAVVSETRLSPWHRLAGALKTEMTPFDSQEACMMADLFAGETPRAKSPAIKEREDATAATLRLTVAAQQIGLEKRKIEIEASCRPAGCGLRDDEE